MTDFELTRFAFKAAFSGADLTEDKDMMRRWSPLTDDGDALRLAVQLGISVWRDDDIVWCNETKIHTSSDPYAAARRAIVRAAAEIGKGMK